MHSYECKLKETPWTWSIIYIVVIYKRRCSSQLECCNFDRQSLFQRAKRHSRVIFALVRHGKDIKHLHTMRAACYSHEWYMKRKKERKTRFFIMKFILMNWRWWIESFAKCARYLLKNVFHSFQVRHAGWKKHTKNYFNSLFFRGQRILYGN